MTPRRRWAISSLLSLGFGVALVAMLSFANLFLSSTDRLHRITHDLYLHPFAVSNAAASLKLSLYQMRSSALLLVLMQTQGTEWNNTAESIESFDATAHAELEIIKANFLGDMTKVTAIETKLHEWHEIRARILSEVKNGNFSAANTLVRQEGSPKFNELIELTDYVLDFAKLRAKQFIDEGEQESTQLIDQGKVLSAILLISFITTATIVFLRVNYLQTELSRQAMTDFLTGIPNRRHFLAQTERELSRAKRYREPLALAVADLDFFKQINDRYGHPVGDAVLKQFCAICHAQLRESDCLGRLGGEEFGILMPKTSPAEGYLVLERIRASLAEAHCPAEKNEKVRFSASFGLAVAGDSDTKYDFDALFKHADLALYKAKESGRNTVKLANEHSESNEV